MLDIPTQSLVRSDPQAILLAEHARGREICALATALAQHDPTDLPWIEATAAHLVAYFQGELVVHERDEEEIVAKALVAHDRKLAATIGLLVTQHAMLRDAAARVLGAWVELEVRPAALEEMAGDLAAGTARLVSMVESHLDLEEQLIVPRLAELPAAEQRAICAKLHVPRT